MINILVVDDNQNTCRLFETILSQNDYKVYIAYDGILALDILKKNHIDLIISDIMMPNMDGYEFTKYLRDNEINTPLIMVTAKDSIFDKKIGFKIGADDYLIKPFDEEEILLRVEALLRRSKIVNSKKTIIGETEIDYDNLSVSYYGKVLELPQKEFLLLTKLIGYQNKIFTRRQLMDDIWGLNHDTDERTIDVHINRLRERFKDNNDFEIVTIRGLGYKVVSKS